MRNDALLQINNNSLQALRTSLLAVNETSAQFGLVLSPAEAETLLAKHSESLYNTGRIALGDSILPQLAYHFCDSAYVSPYNWTETLYELCESFYYFKNASGDTIDDEDLLRHMRYYFDEVCEGSIEYLNDTTLDILRREMRLNEPPSQSKEV